jgi:hypothetical protein
MLIYSLDDIKLLIKKISEVSESVEFVEQNKNIKQLRFNTYNLENGLNKKTIKFIEDIKNIESFETKKEIFDLFYSYSLSNLEDVALFNGTSFSQPEDDLLVLFTFLAMEDSDFYTWFSVNGLPGDPFDFFLFSAAHEAADYYKQLLTE